MKWRYNGLLILILIGVNGALLAQPTDKQRDSLANLPYNGRAIKTNPLALIWSQIPLTGEARIMFEQRLTRVTTTMVSLSYVFKSPIFALAEQSYNNNNNTNIKYKINGLRIQGMQKFYLFNPYSTKTEPEGLYIAPHFSINSARITAPQYPETYISLNFINLNLMGGVQLIAGPFALDGYIGLGVRHNFIQTVPRPGHQVLRQNINQYMPRIIAPNLKISLSTNLGFVF